MNRQNRLRLAAASVLALTLVLIVCLVASAERPAPSGSLQAETVGQAFSYQGYLEEGGNPADGLYDLLFYLYDAPTEGKSIGAAIQLPDTPVVQGQFSVMLDFDVAFQGEQRFIEIQVRGPADGSYTTLAPRQEITAVPYAQCAQIVHGAGPVHGVHILDAGMAAIRIETCAGDAVQVDDAGSDGLYIANAGYDGVSVGQTGRDGLHIDAATNDGVHVASAGADGLCVMHADRSGLNIMNAEINGIEVNGSGQDGVYVYDAGDDGVHVHRAHDDGFQIDDAGGDGVYVRHADRHGLRIDNAGEQGVSISTALYGFVVFTTTNHGFFVQSAGDVGYRVVTATNDGFDLDWAGDDGLEIGYAGDVGVLVHKAGKDGFSVSEAMDDGFQVYTATNDGLYVNWAVDDGVDVLKAGQDGLYVREAGRHGIRVKDPGEAGVYVDDAVTFGLYIGGSEYDGIYVNPCTRRSATFGSDVHVGGTLSKAAGGFKIDHPLDPENRYLQHSFVESPDMLNLYSGNAILDGDGRAWVALPEWFEALNRDCTYQLTPIGGPAPDLHIASEIKEGRFRIAGGSPGLKISWQVTGIRQDAYAQAYPIIVDQEKPPEERGTYLHAEAHGQPAARSLSAVETQRLNGEETEEQAE